MVKASGSARSVFRAGVPHESLQAGDACPQCLKGTVYANPAGVLIRFSGRSPVQATIYALQKLRCHVCGKVLTAQPPAGVGSEKYDATVVSMPMDRFELERPINDLSTSINNLNGGKLQNQLLELCERLEAAERYGDGMLGTF